MTYRPSMALVAGFLIGLVPLVVAEPIGRLADLCTDLFGCTGTVFFAGAPAGIIAGLLVARWWEILELVLGIWLGAAAFAVVATALDGGLGIGEAAIAILVQVPLGAGVFLGFLGVPLFVIVTVIRWAARRNAGGGSADRTS